MILASGTFSFLGRSLGRRVGMALGKGFGAGLQQNIEDAYRYLMDRFEGGDKVFLFGFSRGAYTVRALAGMLYRCGLLQKGSINLIPYASKIYNERSRHGKAAGFKETYGRDCKPYFIGVWDTVGSMGWCWGKKFFDATLNPDVKYGYHAVSIDEKRKKFPVSLWDEDNKADGQTIEQVWFAGVHSDVGGWYDEVGLSDIALGWMLTKAEEQGLRLKPQCRSKLKPDSSGLYHESRTGWFWRIWRPVLRPIPRGSLIHESVVNRQHAAIGYDPKNIPDEQKVVV